GLIHNPSVAGPLRLTLLMLFAIAGLVLGYLALGLRHEEKQWAKNVVRREDRVAAAPRATELRDDSQAAAPPRSRPAVAVAEPPKPVMPAGRAAGRRPGSAQQSLALGDNSVLPAADLLTAAPDKGT